MIKKYNLQPVLPQSAGYIMKSFYSDISKTRSRYSLESLINGYLNSKDIDNLTLEDKLSVKLFFEIFLDLVRQGWSVEFSEDTLYAIPPDGKLGAMDKVEIKKRIREGLAEARNEQLREPSVKKFVLEQERPRLVKGKQVSVLNHFLKPIELYRDLDRRMKAPEEIRMQLLKDSIKPYLQLVNGERDQFTNIRLNDIWRYARYTWSLPLSSQPGRQMNYLIRDASREFHPIIGIGALGNSIVQITSRDNFIGWTLESLSNSDSPEQRLQALERALDKAIYEVYSEDLLAPEELVNPSEETLEKLLLRAKEVPSVSRTQGKLNNTAFEEDTKQPIYVSKRATELYQLLSSKRTFERISMSDLGYDHMFQTLMNNEEGRRALGVALRSIKKNHIGSSIMDITTCGAVAPYSELLGGKLVSLLMTSPQVINDYMNKYKNSVSEIASRMKGEAVVRPAHLVLLGTTSLYYTGSSQYNRIKVPVKNGRLEFIHVGQTRGFGSVHLSNKTYKVLQELLRTHSELKPESSTFAAGVNYKMRSIGSGLGHLGLRKLQQHENPRLVYLAPLATNWKEYLLGLDSEPNYLFDINNIEQQTQELVNFWRDRWYIRRIFNNEVMYRLKNQGTVKVSDFLSHEERSEMSEAIGVQQLEFFGGEEAMPIQKKISWKILAELKDQRASFAERLSDSELESLHIDTRLDSNFNNLLESGKRIYLVGNPGDGKTHIIKKNIAYLDQNQIFYNLDASAIDEGSLLARLLDVINNNQPAVIAINEGPLRRLVGKLPEEERNQLIIQLDKPFIYGSENEVNCDALVVNLGLRQVLTKTILEGALDTVLKNFDYSDAPMIIRYNHSMLSRTRVRERFITLLGFLAKGGSHITMHELLGFLAGVITSGIKDLDQAHNIKPYFDAMFTASNHLCSLMEKYDPASISHPLVDMWLVDGNKSNIEWLELENDFSKLEIDTYSSDRLSAFPGKKRRFYFEAKEGHVILNMLPDDYRTYYELLSNSRSAKQLAKKKIIEALSNFFGQGLEDSANGLQIWTSIKYESKRDANVFISSQRINESLIDIYVPKLRRSTEDLLEFEPSHIRVIVRAPNKNAESTGIDIDLDLWLSLMKIKRGLLNRHQDPVIVRKLTTFMSHLSAQNDDLNRDFVNIQVLDATSGNTHQINVTYGHEQKGKYVW